MAKGPSYTDEEQKLLNELAKKGAGPGGESPTVLAAEYVARFGDGRSLAALVQKIRKMVLAREEAKTAKKAAKASPSATGSSSEAPKRRGRPPKVNTAPISDAPPAKRRGRPPKALTLTLMGQPTPNGTSAHVPTNGNGNGVVTVDLGEGLMLVGSKKRVGETLQKLA